LLKFSFSNLKLGKGALSQKKQSRVESFQHSSRVRAVKATGIRYDWMWLRVPLDGVFIEMTERNVNTQCGAAIRDTEGMSVGL